MKDECHMPETARTNAPAAAHDAGDAIGAAPVSASRQSIGAQSFCQAEVAPVMRDCGIVMLSCDVDGAVISTPFDGASWFGEMCMASAMFRKWLRDAASVWNTTDGNECFGCQAAPGLWLLPLPLKSRRRIVGYDVAILLTDEFIRCEQLPALCQSAAPAGADLELCRRRLLDLPPASRRDLPRLMNLLQLAHRQRTQLAMRTGELEAVGQQLAESYEEMNLLYTITQNMTVQEPPARFIARACEELMTTLPYAWIGLQLIDDPIRLKALTGRLIVAGTTGQPPAFLRQQTQMLFAKIVSDNPVVLEPGSNPKHADFSALGKTIVVQPVMAMLRDAAAGQGASQNEVVGLLLACDKQGPDRSVSNIDIKLLGAAATHMAIFLENAALYDDLNAMFMGTLEALTASIDAKDRYTCGHSRRVAHLTQLLAQASGMDDLAVGRCRIAGLVHDVGKIGVPEAVLLKPGKLNDEEFAWIKKHPEIGHRILKDIPQLSDVLPGVLHHHERWDGRGYPDGLQKAAIPLVARLIGLADSFDAMSSTRTYRSSMSRAQVLDEIRNCAGAQFDPDLAHLFVNLDFSEYDRLARAHRATESNDVRRAA